MSIRPVKRLIKSKPTLEGAGVHLRRAFGFGNTSDFDPFLLLDDFRNDVPEDYLAGFPWHPHRGIETDHLRARRDRGAWRQHGQPRRHRRRRRAMDDRRQRHHPPGDAQGRPRRPDARLPVVGQSAGVAEDDRRRATRKSRPAEIPEVTDDDGTHVRLVCGNFWGKTGPVDGIAADPIYLDVSVPPGQQQDPAGRDHAPRLCLRLRRLRANSATPPARWPCPPKASDGWTPLRPPRPTIARWSSSIAATKSPSRPAKRASASCWSPASPSRSR